MVRHGAPVFNAINASGPVHPLPRHRRQWRARIMHALCEPQKTDPRADDATRRCISSIGPPEISRYDLATGLPAAPRLVEGRYLEGV